MDYNAIAQSALDAPFYAQQKRTELAWLLEFLAPRKLKNILEIGVMKGGTIKAWTEIATKDADIIGIDLPGGEYGGGHTEDEAELIENLAKYNQTITLFEADSHDPETRNLIQRFAPFDFIFIDGDHTFEGVVKDFQWYAPLVKRGGLVAFHDILEYKKTTVPIQVYLYWEKLRTQFPLEKIHEFIDLDYPSDHGQWGGIGVIEL